MPAARDIKILASSSGETVELIYINNRGKQGQTYMRDRQGKQ